jgi:uncharacterized SAM-binding protein YcdF (DUF218 family)
MIKFILKTFVALIIIIGLGWCYGLYHFLETISYCSIPNDKADAIVIFTGEKGRISQGLELLRVYPNTPILVSGIGHNLNNLPMAKKLQSNIVGDITLGRDARNTLGNAEETKQWTQERGIKSIRLVTSHYHMPRSLRLLRRAIPELNIIAHPIISDNFQSEGWWNNQRVYRMIVAEYNKYLVICLQDFIGF